MGVAVTLKTVRECGNPIALEILKAINERGYSKEVAFSATVYLLGVLFGWAGREIDFDKPVKEVFPELAQGFKSHKRWIFVKE